MVGGLHQAAERRGISSRVVEVVPRERAASRLPFGLPGDRARLLDELSGAQGVIVHGVFQADVARARRLLERRLPDVPLVLMPHDAYDDGLFERRRVVKHVWFTLVERPSLRRSRAILTTAPAHEQWLRRRGVRTTVVMCPLGLTPEERGAAERVLEGRSARRRSRTSALVHIGRWDIKEKGLDLSLAAVAALPKGTAGLRVVGHTEGQRKRLTSLVHALGAPAELVGFVASVWDELLDADLLLMPSRKEGFGLAPLLALSCGVPVLLSSRAGLSEHVSRADGCVVAEPEVRSTSAALRDALAHLDELTDAARRFAAEKAPALTYDALLDAALVALSAPA